jgi:hypothetical protein
MEILIFFIGAVVGVLFWIGPFVENADPKKNPVRAGLKKMSEGMIETVEAVGKGTTNSLAEYKYKLKFEKGEKLTGNYNFLVRLPNHKSYEVLINYSGGINRFDIENCVEKGEYTDILDSLTDSEKHQLNQEIRTQIRNIRASIGLNNDG